jgi:cell wall assembly regulator SMI1
MIQPILQRLDRWLATHRPQFHSQLRPGIDSEALAKLTKKLRFPLPENLRALLEWHDGSKAAGENFLWNYRLLSANEIAEATSMFRGHLKAGEFEDKVDWWVDGWIPLLGNGADDYICLDTLGSFGGSPGQLLQFYHDDYPRDGIAPSVDAWFDALVSAFENGLFEQAYPREEEAFRAHLAAALPGYPKDAAARKNDAKARARISTRDAVKNAVATLDGPVADLAIRIDPEKVLKPAQRAVAEACDSLSSRRASATVEVFEVLAAPNTKRVAYAVWSTSTVGETWRDGYVVGIDLKGQVVLKDKKVQA